jgi:AraC-like DNA-binding protein
LSQGTLHLAGVGAKTIAITEGDILFVLSGEVHSLRQMMGALPRPMPKPEDGPQSDRPSRMTVGEGAIAARLLCGSLQVRWPSGQRPRGLPGMLRINRGQSIIGLDRLWQAAEGEGATALLNHAATLLLMNGLREHPRCQALFDESNQLDPIDRAKQLIELHPFRSWTVEVLARKVGMSRSNFCARFTARTGATPMDMLTRERMNHAVHLLTKTDLKIAQIGERIGYQSEAGFHHRFTAFFGMPPRRLRETKRLFSAPIGVPPNDHDDRVATETLIADSGLGGPATACATRASGASHRHEPQRSTLHGKFSLA